MKKIERIYLNCDMKNYIKKMHNRYDRIDKMNFVNFKICSCTDFYFLNWRYGRGILN